MKRRSFIQRLLLLLGLESAGWFGCATRGVESDASRAPLSSHELDDLVALGEALVDGRLLAEDERRYLVTHIAERARESADARAMYRLAALSLERLAGRPFAAFDIRERIDLIARHRLAAPVLASDTEPLSDEMRALRAGAVPDLIRGYYSSPAGWAAVGYESFPGRCGDLARYTRPDAQGSGP